MFDEFDDDVIEIEIDDINLPRVEGPTFPEPPQGMVKVGSLEPKAEEAEETESLDHEPILSPLEDPYFIDDQPILENAVLGAIFSSPVVAEVGIGGLVSDHFVGKKTRLIAAAMSSLFIDFDTVPDINSVTHELKRRKFTNTGRTWFEVITPSFLSTLSMHGTGEVDFKHCYRQIEDDFKLRSLSSFTSDLNEALDRAEYNSSEEPLSLMESTLLQLEESAIIDNADVSISNIVDNTLEFMADRQGRTGEIIGVATGYKDLDTYTSGLQAGQLVVLAGRPGTGKTSAAIDMACHMAIDNDVPVLFFEMEMLQKEMMQRIYSSRASIPHDYIKTSTLSESEWARLASEVPSIRDSHLFIQDNPDQTISSIKSQVFQFTRRINTERGDEPVDAHKTPVVFIDYLGLMNTSDSNQRGNNYSLVIAEITRALKVMASSQQIAVVLCVQLSRGPETRDNHRPIMSDLRDSGAIEQDADIILFTYRDIKYHPTSGDGNIAELIISKHRAGALGTVHLAFDQDYATFRNLSSPPGSGGGGGVANSGTPRPGGGIAPGSPPPTPAPPGNPISSGYSDTQVQSILPAPDAQVSQGDPLAQPF